MAASIRTREPRVIVIGSLLILIGSILLLDRLDLFYFRWDRVVWLLAAFFGGFFVVDGFMRKRRGRVFWGGFLFSVSVFYTLLHWGIIDRYDFYNLPAFLISMGLAFVMLYAYEPREVMLFVPAILFLGTGTAMILWWWEVVDWWDIRYAVRTYWPLLLVVWGAAIILKRRPPVAKVEAGPPPSSGDTGQVT